VPQRLRATKTPPVALLGGMAFVKPSLGADPLRLSGLFLSLAHGRQRARTRNVFFEKTHLNVPFEEISHKFLGIIALQYVIIKNTHKKQ